MIFDPQIWDVLLIIAASYFAVVSLVRMMRSYRQDLILNMRATVIERQTAKREAMKRRPKPESEAQSPFPPGA